MKDTLYYSYSSVLLHFIFLSKDHKVICTLQWIKPHNAPGEGVNVVLLIPHLDYLSQRLKRSPWIMHFHVSSSYPVLTSFNWF